MINRRTHTRDSSVDTIVVGDLVRPDSTPTVLINCKEIAAPIGEINCVAIHGRSSRNISTGCERPFWFQAFDVGGTDRVLCRLAPSVAEILAAYPPFARSSLRCLALCVSRRN